MKMVHALILDVNCGEVNCPNCPGYVYQIRESNLATNEYLVIDESDVFKNKEECQKACQESRPKYIAAYERILKESQGVCEDDRGYLQ